VKTTAEGDEACTRPSGFCQGARFHRPCGAKAEESLRRAPAVLSKLGMCALVHRIAPSMMPSIRLAQHESEGHNEELIALVIADMKDPVAPILEAALAGEGSHYAGRLIARLSKVVHHGAAAIEKDLFRVRAVEIHLSHVQPLSNANGSPRYLSVADVLDGRIRKTESVMSLR
jgi:hypothetical protein